MLAKMLVKSTLISARSNCLQSIDKRGNSIQSLFASHQKRVATEIQSRSSKVVFFFKIYVALTIFQPYHDL